MIAFVLSTRFMPTELKLSPSSPSSGRRGPGVSEREATHPQGHRREELPYHLQAAGEASCSGPHQGCLPGRVLHLQEPGRRIYEVKSAGVEKE